jgi:hypothetical protein
MSSERLSVEHTHASLTHVASSKNPEKHKTVVFLSSNRIYLAGVLMSAKICVI